MDIRNAPGKKIRKAGTLKIIVGCMCSGKGEFLLRSIARIAPLGKILAFKSALDARDGACIRSRAGGFFPAISIKRAEEIFRHLAPENKVVIIDEAELFGADIVETVGCLMDLGKEILVAGLDADFAGRPFGPMPFLMAIPEAKIVKLTARCAVCGGRATRTQRLINGQPAPADAPIISIEGRNADEKYEPRCRKCHRMP